jgi:hypothetical protein
MDSFEDCTVIFVIDPGTVAAQFVELPSATWMSVSPEDMDANAWAYVNQGVPITPLFESFPAGEEEADAT